MPNVVNRFTRLLDVAGEYVGRHPFVQAPIYNLFQLIDDGVAQTKRRRYALKTCLYPLYLLVKYRWCRTGTRAGDNGLKHVGVRILAVIHGSGPQHYGDVMEVVEDLIGRDQKVLVPYGTISTSQRRHLEELEGVYPLNQNQLVFDISLREFGRNMWRSIRCYHELRRAVADDRDLSAICKRYRGFLLDQFFVCLSYFNLAARVIDGNDIDVVLSSSDGSEVARGFFAHANLKGIRNCILTHGISPLSSVANTAAQTVVLWSRTEVEYYLRHGFPAERIASLGLPRLDAIHAESVEPRYDISTIYGTPRDRRRVCFGVALHAYYTYERFFEVFVQEIRTISLRLAERGIAVVLRAHPNDNLADYAAHFGADLMAQVIVPPQDFPFVQLIKQTDVYVTHMSTSLIESMLAGVPTICFNVDRYFGTEVLCNERMSDGCCCVTRQQDLAVAIANALCDDGYRTTLLDRQARFLTRDIINLGHARARITEHILNGLSES